MANDVVLSSGVKFNLLNLQKTASLLEVRQRNLSTGLSVNSALDNPTNFFTASALNSRANDLTRLLDGVSNGVQTIKAADKGISAIKKLVENAQAISRQARTSSLGAVSYSASTVGTAITHSAEARSSSSGIVIGNAATGTNLNGNSIGFSVKGADGGTETFTVTFGANQFSDESSLGAADGDDANAVAAALNDNTSFSEFLEATVNGSGELVIQSKAPTDYKTTFEVTSDTTTGAAFSGATVTDAVNLLKDNNISDGDTLTVKVGDGETQTITFGVGGGKVATYAELETALSGITGVTASVDSVTNQITVELDSKTETQFSIGGAAAGKVGLTVGTTQDTDGPTIANLSSTRAAYQSDFNAILKQIDELARDTSYNGNNLLDGDSVKVIFNEDGDHSLTLRGVTFNSAGLGISQVSGDGFQVNGNIDATLNELDTAIQRLRDQGAKFGSQLSTVEARQEFTKDLTNVLTVGADNLVVADSNEEGVKLLSLQTRQTLSTTTLSLANQSEQNVLRLF